MIRYKKVWGSGSIHTYFILYNLLKERTEEVNISHKEMPSFFKHMLYVNKKSKSYKEWLLIYDGVTCVGQVYLTSKNTIGIQIHKQYHRKGYGEQALKYIIDKYPKENLLANVNPSNKPSIKLFEKLGFRHIQNTYKRDTTS